MSTIPPYLSSYLDEHAFDAQHLLETLCRQPSVAAQHYGITEMADLTEQLLRETGFHTQRLTVEHAPPYIYAEMRGRSPYTLLLYNHYDVQPAEPLELWHSQPYTPEVRDGFLYARGVSDNKGEFASRLAAIRALLAVDGELPITIRWIIEGEEEIGSPHFAALAAQHADLLRADGCLWEGTNFADDGRPVLSLGTKGLLYLQLDVQKIALDAHSGNAAILPSAAWRLLQALATLRSPEGYVRIPGFYDTVQAPSPTQRAALVEQSSIEDHLKELYQVDEFVDNVTGPTLREYSAFRPTCNIAGISSGYAGEGIKTVLPAQASAKLDFRLVPDQDPELITHNVRTYLQQQGYTDITVTVLASSAAVVTPLDNGFAQRVIAISEDFAQQQASIIPIMSGTLPLLGALQRYVGVPGLSAPGNVSYWGSAAHAPNENIRLSDLARGVRYNCYLFQQLGNA